jgi:group I intron endonuclease
MISIHRFDMDTDAPSHLCGIYAIRHRETGKTYVGQVGGTSGRGFRKRCQEHVYNATKAKCQHEKSRLGRAVRKIGTDAFDFVVLEVISADSSNDIFDTAEIKWTDHFDSLGINGYNVHMGPTPRGVRRSEETRRRMSEARKKLLADNPDMDNKIRSMLAERNRLDSARELTAKRNSDPDMIARRTEGLRKRFADPQKRIETKLKTQETRKARGTKEAIDAKMAEYRSNPENYAHFSKQVICIETGEKFPSIRSTARHLGVTKTAVHRNIYGKSATCKGFRFKFVDETA